MTATGECGRRVKLPVIQRRRRVLRWRVGVLIGVHVAIAAHIVQWALTGRTVSPVVASDAMHTLERGEINNGFILLAAAALVTVVCGRFLCGWLCHMGGLQDFCAWVLKRVGIRPRLMRARLLGYVPVAIAGYMFVWPTLKREAIVPLARAWWPESLAVLNPGPAFPGWTNHLMTDDMWARLPGVWVAVPFVLVCGCATVYFLGARGFCRYGCPYGGLLSPLEQLAPVRIAVDADACTHCGLCTAACGSGVRVMEETRAHGRIVSRHCTKSLDCVEACPTHALKLRVARPAILKRGAHVARREYDLGFWEEIAALGVFAATFAIVRGLYGVVPMFMAIGIGACTAGLLWQCRRTLTARDARFAGMQLTRGGRIKAGGFATLGMGLVALAILAHSAAVRVILWRASEAEARIQVPREVVFGGRRDLVPAADVEAAGEALALYRLGGAWKNGGIGLAGTPEAGVREAWLHLVRGEYGEAERSFRDVLARAKEGDGACSDLGRVIVLRGEPERATVYLDEVWRRHPDFAQVRDMLCWLCAASGNMERAEEVCRGSLAVRPRDARLRAMLASLLMQRGLVEEGVAELRRAAGDSPRDAVIRHDLAIALFERGDVDSAKATMEEAMNLEPRFRDEYSRQLREMLGP